MLGNEINRSFSPTISSDAFSDNFQHSSSDRPNKQRPGLLSEPRIESYWPTPYKMHTETLLRDTFSSATKYTTLLIYFTLPAKK